MALMESKNANGECIRLVFYPNRNEFVIFIGKRIYDVAYELSKAYVVFFEAM